MLTIKVSLLLYILHGINQSLPNISVQSDFHFDIALLQYTGANIKVMNKNTRDN